MTTHASLDLYSGATLEAWLDDVEATLSNYEEAGLSDDHRQALLRDLLARPRFRPDTLRSTARLGNLWLQTGDLEQALRVADTDGERVLAILPGHERSTAMIDLDFWRISAIVEHPRSPETREVHAKTLADALHAAERRLASLPMEEQPERVWLRLAEIAYDSGQFECARRCAVAQHELQLAQPGRSAYRAYDRVTLSLRLGQSLQAEGHAQAAHQAATEAYEALAEAAPDQSIDYDDWLNLGQSLLKLRPDLSERLCQRVLTLAPPGLAPGPKRDMEVRLARLEARALFAQGDLEGALAKGRRGRFGLTLDDDDAFSAEYMDWLIAAQRLSEAAELAYESIDCEREISSQHACSLSLRHAKQASERPSQASPYWHLALANAASQEEMQWVCGDTKPEDFRASHLRAAHDIAAASDQLDRDTFSAAVSALQAHQLLQDQPDYRAALALLDLATRNAAHANNKNIEALWNCRMQLFGAERAMQMPFVPGTASVWNYNVAVNLEFNTRQKLPASADWPIKDVKSVCAKYYELGLSQFEDFFSSGAGRFKDADVHGYSMLCNNLALYYYSTIDDPEEVLAKAVPLHEKGIAASPFAEHYSGILYCLIDAEDQPGLVAAAENLWEFSEDHGFSRHDPAQYIGTVAHALHNLDRGLEIGIWLQRLDHWWNGLDSEERDERNDNYVRARTVTLSNLMKWHAEDALPRLEAFMPQVIATSDPDTVRLAGCGLEHAGRIREAMEVYRKAIALTRRGDELQELIREKCLIGIADCKLKLKPWWQFWD